MYKLIICCIIAFTLSGCASKEPITTTEVNVVKSKSNKTAKKVKEEHNAFIKDCVIFCRLDSNQLHASKEPYDMTDGNFFYRSGYRNQETILEEAKKFQGKTAKNNKKELKALFVENNIPPVDPVYIPWCAAFANAILNRQGIEGTNSLLARSFLNWGYKTKDPKEGDIVVVKRGRSEWAGHVGFFAGYEWYNGVKYVVVYGGNTDRSVQAGYFLENKVLGYRTPG
jgi:uncharacterized protein (TIGR02594 family)